LARARKRLASFVNEPDKHLRYAAKVLLKFKLLEAQQLRLDALLAWGRSTPLLVDVHQSDQPQIGFEVWVNQLVTDLVRSGAATRNQQSVFNAN
jgi:hypothetical protein